MESFDYGQIYYTLDIDKFTYKCGIHFSTKKNVKNALKTSPNSYNYLYLVLLPLNDPDLKVVCSMRSGWWKSNKIMIGLLYSLKDDDEYEDALVFLSEPEYNCLHH